MDGNIIDLQGYLADRASHFAVWGGEGKRARFALPLWRAASLAAARRAVLVKRPRIAEEVVLRPTLVTAEDSQASVRQRQVDETEPVFVLDLGSSTARTDVDGADIPAAVEPPLVLEGPEVIVVALGTKAVFDWFLMLDTPGEGLSPLSSQHREQLLFFAGECAGLLEQEGIAKEMSEGSTEPPPE